jgi:hypothetical protein
MEVCPDDEMEDGTKRVLLVRFNVEGSVKKNGLLQGMIQNMAEQGKMQEMYDIMEEFAKFWMLDKMGIKNSPLDSNDFEMLCEKYDVIKGED